MTLFIVGAGGFGRETYDAVLAACDGTEPVVFCDHALAGEKTRGLPIVHPEEVDDDFVVAISDPDVRARLSAELEGRGLTPRTIVHPRAVIGPETVLGAG